jgi:hypothetical protein
LRSLDLYPDRWTIEVNVAGGGTASRKPSCTCPIYDGPAIADLDGGNMQGSCEPPGPDQVWSLYWPKTGAPGMCAKSGTVVLQGVVGIEAAPSPLLRAKPPFPPSVNLTLDSLPD